MKSYFEYAKSLGKIVFGYGLTDIPEECEQGLFLPPTIITDIPQDDMLNRYEKLITSYTFFQNPIFHQKLREEIFGPVTVVSKFATEKEAIELANDTKYGLCATLWSENISRANRVAKQLKVGTVWTNCWLVRDLTMPFGRKLMIKIFN